MRILPILVVAALLAACGADSVPLPSPPSLQLASMAAPPLAATAELGEDRWTASDGAVLPLRRWLPEGRPRALILALHGFNDYANAFDGAGARWARRGIATYAYDQRGFGRAPWRGRWPGARVLASDAAQAIAALRRRHPGIPVYLLGESMGGAVAILSATGQAETPVPKLDGVILVAPAIWGRQTMTLFERSALWLAARVPAMRLSARALPIRIEPSDNLPMLRAYSADPLVIKDTRADALEGLVDLMSAALAAAPAFAAPALILYGERDQIVPAAPMARFVAALPPLAQRRQRLALYPEGYHMLLRDLGAAAPIEDIAGWINDPAASLASGADREAPTRLGISETPVTATTALVRGAATPISP